MERRRHGDACESPERGHRRAPFDVRELRLFVRGRVQSFLQREVRRRTGRPGLLPGTCLPWHLRQSVRRGPADRGAARRIPPRGVRWRPTELPPPRLYARLLGVPDGLDGPRADKRHLPGACQPLSHAPRARGHECEPCVVLRGRRRARRARGGGRSGSRRPRAPRQLDIRRQLQLAATRRSRQRQRQDHPGVRSDVPGCRMERHKGDLGITLGRAARQATSTACCSTR